MNITLPFPPSVNTYWRTVNGRTMLSAKAREYQNACAAAMIGMRGVTGKVFVMIELFPPDDRERDSDNYNKGLFDALVKSGAIESDSNRCVVGHTVMWHPKEKANPRATVRIEPASSQEAQG